MKWSERNKTVTVEIEVKMTEIAYLRQIAFNRFLDNVVKALKGDHERRANLLAEDIADVRDYIEPIIQRVKNKI